MAERPVILVHGLWLGSWCMRRLERALTAAGRPIHPFDYQTVAGTFEADVERLGTLINHLGPAVDLVAHSLGGVLALHALQQAGSGAGQVVLLGSPIAGSRVARRFRRLPLGERLLGCAAGPLAGPAPPPPPGWQVSMVAGRLRLGLGVIVGGFGQPGDGTVDLDETRADWLAHHEVLAESHTSLLFSRRSTETVCRLLAGDGQ